MKLFKKILNKLNGLHYSQEYLCISKESFLQPLHVYLTDDRTIIKDITNEHLFTGYSPLIFTLYSSSDEYHLPDAANIIFSRHQRQLNEIPEKKDAIARLYLKMIRRQSAGDLNIVYYESITGTHRFISPFHQYIIGLDNTLYNQKPGNVFLPNNLYKQVQIAYSIPRIISLITVSDRRLFNLFPTDLHGAVNDQYYISSLRHEGMACKQVENSGRIVISQIHCNDYKTAYSLGKNHMKELKPWDHFPFSDISSPVFQLPLPQSVLYYRELELMDSFIHGIHKILLYRIISQQTADPEPATLAHVHNVYATWRHNKGLGGNYLLR